jgi:catechol 2,3-dioxygenase-like lactoylglutathione lyase family enzyme
MRGVAHFPAVCEDSRVLHHAAFAVPAGKSDVCAAFWALLGFTEIEPPATLRGRTRWLARGQTQIHLLLAEDARPARDGTHVAVVAEDFDDVLARLAAAGFPADPRERHWGAPRAYVLDPVGHRIEVMAWPPG